MSRSLVLTPGDAHLARQLTDALRNEFTVVSVPGEFGSRADAEASLGAPSEPAAVVHVCGDESALVPSPVGSTEAADWDARGERLLRSSLFTLQAAHGALSASGGGRIVLVTATTGISGAPMIVPFVTAVEGVRAMAKSAARQWGASGITVNTVLVPLEMIAPRGSGLTSFLSPPALGALPSAADDLAAAISWFAGRRGEGITGATIVVDGGSVMAP